MELQIIQRKIHEIRGQRVMLDFDLAELYEVETRALKQSVKRNTRRFPPDFMFELSESEIVLLVSQNVIPSKSRLGGALPFAFTEQGVAMLSSVLRSNKAIDTNIAVMRAFVALRRYALTFDEIASKVLEHDKEIADINEALRQLAPDEPDPNTWEGRPRIGFKK
ncbi:MAG: ORF6N domain-containing protein [Lewinellaceae bacterium]|nr:ORF6N domain-containing protein [Lewinellaceae bacterium]